jgi:hypothetical protein
MMKMLKTHECRSVFPEGGKKLLYFLVCIMLTLTLGDLPKSVARPRPGQSDAQASPEFTMTLSTLKGVVKTGSPIEVSVVTANTSQDDIFFSYPASLGRSFGYDAEVRDTNGNAPPDTQINRVIRARRLEGSFTSVRVQSGTAWTETIDISKLYDFREPGTYTIRVQRRDIHSPVLVKSNSVTVQVVENENLPSVPALAQPSVASPAFSLTIWTSRRVVSFRPREVWCEVITKNISDHKIFLHTEMTEQDELGPVYKVDVRDRNGALAPEGESGRLAKIDDQAPPSLPPASPPRQGGQSLRLLPGEDWSDMIQLKDLYDIKIPGQYTIQVRRWDDETKTWVKSNKLTVTVTP